MPNNTLELVVIVKGRLVNLCKTLDSIQKQRVCSSSFSILVVNGKPSDSKVIASIIATSYKSLNIALVDQQSSGIFPAMNEGVLHSSSKWLQFVNSGDESLGLESLLALLSSLNENQVDGVIGTSIVRCCNGSFISVNPLFLPLSQAKFLLLRKIFPPIFSICHQSVVFSRPFHLRNLYQDLCISSDAVVINALLHGRWVSLRCHLSCFYTDGVSSLAPRTFYAFRKLASSLISVGLYRRLINLTIKYVLFGRFSPQVLDFYRRIRFLVFALMFGKFSAFRYAYRSSSK